MGFSRPEYWSGLLFPPLGILIHHEPIVLRVIRDVWLTTTYSGQNEKENSLPCSLCLFSSMGTFPILSWIFLFISLQLNKHLFEQHWEYSVIEFMTSRADSKLFCLMWPPLDQFLIIMFKSHSETKHSFTLGKCKSQVHLELCIHIQ